MLSFLPKNAIGMMLTASTLIAFQPSAWADTQVVMLGTGTPVPDAHRVGSSTAVVYNGKAYVFDLGPGSVHRAIEAAQEKGIKALYPTNISHVFFTHLHSDHILDYAELASTYWWRRTEQINAYGPTGLNAMTENYYKMVETDIQLRTSGLQPIKNPTYYQVLTQEYDHGGWTVKDGDVTIEAFEVPHGDIEPAFGYKVTTPDKTIVISGDTSYNQRLIEKAKGADILVHEVISEAGWSKLSKEWQTYHDEAHTRTSELIKVANQAQPKLLILTHVLHYSAPLESVLSEMKAGYNGKVVLGKDLDVYE